MFIEISEYENLNTCCKPRIMDNNGELKVLLSTLHSLSSLILQTIYKVKTIVCPMLLIGKMRRMLNNFPEDIQPVEAILGKQIRGVHL